MALDFEGFKLTEFPKLILELKHLTHLSFHGNRLTSIPAEIGKLQNLQKLYLSNNQLSTLPAEIVKLKNLQELGLYDNSLETPPLEIAIKGVAAIREYFAALEGKQKPLNEVKVLLVGDGGAGKTSLVKRLLSKKFNKKEEQTDGINIDHWQIRAGNSNMRVNLWDFGGQEIMHATHQFFLSERSLYVLVLDGRKDEKTEYWLRNIETFGGKSPVLVVINKIDSNPGHDVNRVFLQNKYTGIKGFHRISCASGKGLADFSRVLKEALANVENTRITWPEKWFRVKEKLEGMSEHFISLERYQEICDEENITEGNRQEVLVDFLNDLGVVVHFSDFGLDAIHVLEPRWVTEAVYKSINSEILAENKGILKLSKLNTILTKKDGDRFTYPHDTHEFIVKLMSKFELCYRIDNNTILLPDLLEVQECVFDFDYAGSLKIIVEYDFLPKSIMPRFVVNMHKDIKADLRWRTGVVLENKDFQATAVVKSDMEAKRIYIHVDGNQKREYASVIRHTLSSFKKDFKKLDCKELIPCNCEVCEKSGVPRLHEYGTLVKFRQKGVKEFPCPTSVEPVSVDNLLEGIEVPCTAEKILQLLTKAKGDNERILRLLKEIKDNTDGTKIEELAKIVKLKPLDLRFAEIDYVELLNSFRKWLSAKK